MCKLLRILEDIAFKIIIFIVPKKIIRKIIGFSLRKFHDMWLRDIEFKTISNKRITNPEYKIDNFKDILFNTDSQMREKFSIFKLLRSHYLGFLCNGTHSWIAVNIPLNLCGDDIEGDLDILIAMGVFRGDKIEYIYRVFEVKVGKINKDGVCKSLKLKKFNKTKGQLRKIIKAGSQQTFLLEAYILEAGYHRKFTSLPDLLLAEIKKKIKEIKNEDFGYVCVFLEQERGFDEEKAIINHTAKSLKKASIKEATGPIKNIINHIEVFYNTQKKKSGGAIPFVIYCRKCKKLNLLYIQNNPLCNYCKNDIFSF